MSLDMKQIAAVARDADVSVGQMCCPAVVRDGTEFEAGFMSRFLDAVRGETPLAPGIGSLSDIQDHVLAMDEPVWLCMHHSAFHGWIVEMTAYPRKHYGFAAPDVWSGELDTSRAPQRRLVYIETTDDLTYLMRAFRISVDSDAMRAEAARLPAGSFDTPFEFDRTVTACAASA
ncbi:hypothetical protein ACOI1H_13535 [Loktanella sp. DJP18]|uniref:hypothetical protein n=1 Tax=Loktanella sp. DJP18 TaxID=3409788 RepID=UPI003BB69BA7